MKGLVLGLLVSLLSSQAFGDCVNAYEVKAKKRARVFRNLEKVSYVALGGALAVTSVSLLMATNSVLVFAAPITGAGFIGMSVGAIKDTPLRTTNTYYKALDVLEALEFDGLPARFVNDLDKKIDLYSYSDREQEEILRDAVEILKEANADESLCRTSNGKFRPFKYNKIVSLVAKELKEKL